VNGAYTIYAQGDLTATSSASGTAPIILNGTGTWSGSTFSNVVTINTTGTITLGTFNFSGTSLTYVTGSTVCTGTVGLLATITLDTKGSDIPTCGTSSTSGINFNNLTIIQTLNVTNNSNLRVAGTLTTAVSGYNGTWNGSNIYVSGSLLTTGATTNGTALIILDGTGTLSSVGTFSSNITINTAGTITIGSTFIFTSVTLTYLSGKVNAKNSLVTFTAATLVNCHRINFDRVAITSASTVTMNEFFSGSPGLKTTITPSSTTNYTITFQDRTEKFSRFIKISRATLSNPGQLNVITNKGNQGNNIGIRFAPNQRPNGLSKKNPTIKPYQVSGLTPTQLFPDPALS